MSANWQCYLNVYFKFSNLLNPSVCFACSWCLSFHPYSTFSKVCNINWDQILFVTNLNRGSNIVKSCTFSISKSIYCTRIFHFHSFMSSGNVCIHISPDTVLLHSEWSIPLHNATPIKQYCHSSGLDKKVQCVLHFLTAKGFFQFASAAIFY